MSISVNNTVKRSDFTFNYVQSIGFYENIKDKRLNPIPANTIIYKTLTGIGATTAEIKAPRNSIIVLPNLPVIKGKHHKHKESDNTFAVYEDVNVDDVVTYLMAVHQKPKKILTTPESFIEKVKKAMYRLRINMYDSYFLLFDEAHKYILDNGFREEIIQPFELFFKFAQKAIISATPLKFSDPRFKEQGFVRATINPVYDIKQDIKITHTNNISYALRDFIQQNPNDHNCIFYSSVYGIKSLIKSLGIASESKIFCSAFSARELTIEGYQEVYNTFNEESKLTRYNFFTSSFYNGLDIKLEGIKPNIIMLTSVKFAEHTVIDPYTDAAQIIGRFREGFSKVAHITDTNDMLYHLLPSEAVNEFNASAEAYKAISTLKHASPTPFSQRLYTDALSRMKPYVGLLNRIDQSANQNDESLEDEDLLDIGRINHFKLDNYLYHHRVKSYYVQFDSLIEAYETTRRFNVSHDLVYCKLTKDDILRRFGNSRTSLKVYQDITNILTDMEGLTVTDPFEYQRQMSVLNQQFTLIVGAYWIKHSKMTPIGLFEKVPFTS